VGGGVRGGGGCGCFNDFGRLGYRRAWIYISNPLTKRSEEYLEQFTAPKQVKGLLEDLRPLTFLGV